MDTINIIVSNSKSCNWRHGLKQILNLGRIIFSALMIWKSLILIAGTESPVVVVLTESMAPTMDRGDILAIITPQTYQVGDIIVFKVKDREIPIIHRVIQLHEELKKMICEFFFFVFK